MRETQSSDSPQKPEWGTLLFGLGICIVGLGLFTALMGLTGRGIAEILVGGILIVVNHFVHQRR